MSSESDRHNNGDQPQMVGRFCCVYCRKDEAAYDMLSRTYEAEQKQLEVEAITLQQEIEVQERQIESILISVHAQGAEKRLWGAAARGDPSHSHQPFSGQAECRRLLAFDDPQMPRHAHPDLRCR